MMPTAMQRDLRLTCFVRAPGMLCCGLVLAIGMPAAAQSSVCPMPLVEPCVKRHGRLSSHDGSPALRWADQTKLAVVAALLQLTQSPTGEAPEDFALRIVFEQCWNESVDTTKGEFSRTIEPGHTRTARFELSVEQRRRLHALVVEADVFAYPRMFEPGDTSMVEELPPPAFHIEVRSGGRDHVVAWVDRGSRQASARRLRAMIRAIHALVVALPAVQRLPPSRMVCL